MLIWQEIEALAANWRSGVFRLSGDVGAFLLSGTSEFQSRELWVQDDDTPVTDEQWDEIEALTARAYTEIMSPVIVGTIFPFVTNTVPTGALECDGNTYLRTDYPLLYGLLDSVFIVDGDHFVTPDLRGRTVIGSGSGAGLSSYSIGDAGGQEAHTLTSAEMPAHSHGVTDPTHTHSEGTTVPTVEDIGPGVPTPGVLGIVGATGPAFTGISIQNAGGGGAHENRQPFLALRYAIWAS